MEKDRKAAITNAEIDAMTNEELLRLAKTQGKYIDRWTRGFHEDHYCDRVLDVPYFLRRLLQVHPKQFTRILDKLTYGGVAPGPGPLPGLFHRPVSSRLRLRDGPGVDYLPLLLLRLDGLHAAGKGTPAEKDERPLQSDLGALPYAGLDTAGAGEGAAKDRPSDIRNAPRTGAVPSWQRPSG